MAVSVPPVLTTVWLVAPPPIANRVPPVRLAASVKAIALQAIAPPSHQLLRAEAEPLAPSHDDVVMDCDPHH
jgi:hypothetical protein